MRLSTGRLSVIVPAHDAAGSLGEAVRSALAQSRPPDEVVVVDDGSTDATATVAEAFGDPVRVVRQAQGGPSAARNAGVAASSGEWLAFLDADDAWHPDKLARQLAVVAPETAIVACDWTRTLPASPLPASLPTSSISTADIVLLNRFQTSTVVMARRAFEAAGGFDPTLDGVEDWDMWLRASEHGPVVKIDWPLVRYTDVSTGYSKITDRVYRTGLVMLERRFGPVPDAHGREVLAWHHLRFAVAFALAGERTRAWGCLQACRRAGVGGAAPAATVRYLLPFLAGRVRRRFRARPEALSPG